MRSSFLFPLLAALFTLSACQSQQAPQPLKPRVLVSTDIGGTDPDDNQSMTHLLMYANEFDIEGLVSSPSYGTGSKSEILRMISLYESDLPRLAAHADGFPAPDSLRAITVQGRQAEAPIDGFGLPTEGSDWIVKCARRNDSRPLWVLVWGALEDVAQALHDAPDIAPRIRVYWIGGPNKKWGTNAYNYVVRNFPDLWMIECNASYRGFIGSAKDSSAFQAPFFNSFMNGAGALGNDFVNYYGGIAKMGDTPSLLYLMGASAGFASDPSDPASDHWGGRFQPMSQSPAFVINGPLAVSDTVPVYSLLEWRLTGPVADIPADSVCFSLFVDKQSWAGHYVGNGTYVVRYAPKAPASLHYVISSPIPGFPSHEGDFVVGDRWPAVGLYHLSSPSIVAAPIALGNSWWTDSDDPSLLSGQSDYEDYLSLNSKWQGAATVARWRNDVMADWALRFAWLK